ncbi:hypothetical protein [Aeromonas enteropelogenes]|uniref:hypothetical protein n=1 Tax=Aeromonas enteropelogenes TaxID=29489 RepID=UPI003BA1691C
MNMITVIRWLPLWLATSTQAIGINTMLEYADEKGEAEFVITNSEDYRQYINVAISELTVEHGKIKSTAYTRNNLKEWALEAHPARTILDPGFKKVFSMKYLPKPDSVRADQDRMFQISFVPTPYFAEGEKGNAVKMAFGFAPLLIIPAKEAQPLAYEMRYKGDKVTVTNKGSSFFTLYLDGCPKNIASKSRKTCSIDTTVLAGRELDVTLPSVMSAQASLRAKISSHKNKFKAETTLHKQP